jgi:hypothetical protein
MTQQCPYCHGQVSARGRESLDKAMMIHIAACPARRDKAGAK